MDQPDAPAPRTRTVRALSGLSGARVLLMTTDDRHWFVRKIASDAAGSARLRGQMTKQIALAATTDVVATPRVLEHGEIDGRFYFDMEFVRGTDGVSYLRRATYAQVEALSDRFCRYLETVAAQAPDHASSGSLFEALFGKLCEVQQRTSLIDDATLAALFMSLERLRARTAGLATTRCHGDLTLENIVVDDRGQVWLLDLLDAPFEHYWQDLAKLHQDLAGGWYLRSHPPIARYVLDYVSRRLLAAATQLDPSYVEIHPVLLACTFVRILPYVRTPEEQQFVKQRIAHFARLAHGDRP